MSADNRKVKVVIVEDEPLAVERLIGQLDQYGGIEVLAQLDSIKATVKWLNSNPAPDLLFFDIHLADGLSFEIFKETSISSPIIFTTAYDKYALKAFKLNSIDYLLKPIDFPDLKAAIDQYKSLHHKSLDQKEEQGQSTSSSNFSIEQMQETLQMLTQQLQHEHTKKYKSRFVIKQGERLLSITVEEIACFYSEDKFTILQSISGQRFIVNYTIQQLIEQLNPQQFFRINRKYIIRIHAIREIVSYSNSRLKLSLEKFEADDLIVSRDKAQEFKSWLDQ